MDMLSTRDCNGCKYFMGVDIHAVVQCELAVPGQHEYVLADGRCDEYELPDDQQ